MSPRVAAIANTIAALILIALAVVLWRDPGLVIRSEFAKQRSLLGADARELVVGDHRWVYAERAADTPDAPTVVMIHGYTGSKENWYRLAKALKGKYRLVMPDLPGWGQSQRRDGADYGFVAQSARLAAFLEKIDRRPVILIGHSMGGGIAALTAARHPQHIVRLALLDAAGVRFQDNRFGLDVLAGKNPFAVEDQASYERYLSVVFHDKAARPWVPWPVDRIYIAQRRRDAAFEQRVLDRIGRSDERFLPGEEAAKIAQPTLLLWCRQDQVIDPSAMALYAAKITQADQVMLEDCGHMSLMERPGDVAAAVDILIRRQ
ncbi:MAG: alpha/beta hydrolase [Lysobacteraceae bacterium]|nr:MAG: alpha/beta hydrolase [Xanthomonadaceae bacterium]